MEVSAENAAELVGGAAVATTTLALFIRQFLTKFKIQGLEDYKVSAEGDVIKSLRDQLQYLTETNKTLTNEVRQLHEEIKQLRMKNIELSTKICELSGKQRRNNE